MTHADGSASALLFRCWRDQAVCRDVVTDHHDPFFADSAKLQAEAIAICATCPVRDDCLTFAVRTGQQYGIWGGQPHQIIRRLIALERAGRPRSHQAPARHPQASKTHCKRGHRFSADNTYYTPDGQRRCRRCLREAQPTRGRRRRRGGDADVA
jgi:WhiB family transcriptional regulator, redox-sensing transcriptional regulator